MDTIDTIRKINYKNNIILHSNYGKQPPITYPNVLFYIILLGIPIQICIKLDYNQLTLMITEKNHMTEKKNILLFRSSKQGTTHLESLSSLSLVFFYFHEQLNLEYISGLLEFVAIFHLFM